MDLVGRYSNPDDLLVRFERLRESRRTDQPKAARRPKQIQKRLEQQAIADLIGRYRDGGTIDELARHFGIHRTTVMAHLDSQGVERRAGIVQRRIMEAQSLYESGWSLARIGTKFGVDPETVRRALRIAGVSMRQRPGR